MMIFGTRTATFMTGTYGPKGAQRNCQLRAVPSWG
jgi:hypothetical protein